eukprot:Rmarinus@m.5162
MFHRVEAPDWAPYKYHQPRSLPQPRRPSTSGLPDVVRHKPLLDRVDDNVRLNERLKLPKHRKKVPFTDLVDEDTMKPQLPVKMIHPDREADRAQRLKMKPSSFAIPQMSVSSAPPVRKSSFSESPPRLYPEQDLEVQRLLASSDAAASVLSNNPARSILGQSFGGLSVFEDVVPKDLPIHGYQVHVPSPIPLLGKSMVMTSTVPDLYDTRHTMRTSLLYESREDNELSTNRALQTPISHFARKALTRVSRHASTFLAATKNSRASKYTEDHPKARVAPLDLSPLGLAVDGADGDENPTIPDVEKHADMKKDLDVATSVRPEARHRSLKCILKAGVAATRRGDHKAATEFLSAVLRTVPVDATVYTLRARNFLSSGDRTRCVEDAETAIALRPLDPQPHFVRGLALAASGMWAEAARSYEHAGARNDCGLGSWSGGESKVFRDCFQEALRYLRKRPGQDIPKKQLLDSGPPEPLPQIPEIFDLSPTPQPQDAWAVLGIFDLAVDRGRVRECVITMLQEMPGLMQTGSMSRKKLERLFARPAGGEDDPSEYFTEQRGFGDWVSAGEGRIPHTLEVFLSPRLKALGMRAEELRDLFDRIRGVTGLPLTETQRSFLVSASPGAVAEEWNFLIEVMAEYGTLLHRLYDNHAQSTGLDAQGMLRLVKQCGIVDVTPDEIEDFRMTCERQEVLGVTRSPTTERSTPMKNDLDPAHGKSASSARANEEASARANDGAVKGSPGDRVTANGPPKKSSSRRSVTFHSPGVLPNTGSEEEHPPSDSRPGSESNSRSSSRRPSRFDKSNRGMDSNASSRRASQNSYTSPVKAKAPNLTITVDGSIVEPGPASVVDNVGKVGQSPSQARDTTGGTASPPQVPYGQGGPDNGRKSAVVCNDRGDKESSPRFSKGRRASRDSTRPSEGSTGKRKGSLESRRGSVKRGDAPGGGQEDQQEKRVASRQGGRRSSKHSTDSDAGSRRQSKASTTASAASAAADGDSRVKSRMTLKTVAATASLLPGALSPANSRPTTPTRVSPPASDCESEDNAAAQVALQAKMKARQIFRESVTSATPSPFAQRESVEGGAVAETCHEDSRTMSDWWFGKHQMSPIKSTPTPTAAVTGITSKPTKSSTTANNGHKDDA